MLSRQAAEFRQLWGCRAELRRFQDGAITEAVLWDGKSMCQKQLVPRQIITHLLQLYVLHHTPASAVLHLGLACRDRHHIDVSHNLAVSLVNESILFTVNSVP